MNVTKSDGNDLEWIGTINVDGSLMLSKTSNDLNINMGIVGKQLYITFMGLACNAEGTYTVTTEFQGKTYIADSYLIILRK